MDIGDDSDAGEDDLEDELNKLMFGGSKTNKPKKTKGFLLSFFRFNFQKSKGSWRTDTFKYY